MPILETITAVIDAGKAIADQLDKVKENNKNAKNLREQIGVIMSAVSPIASPDTLLDSTDIQNYTPAVEKLARHLQECQAFLEKNYPKVTDKSKLKELKDKLLKFYNATDTNIKLAEYNADLAQGMLMLNTALVAKRERDSRLDIQRQEEKHRQVMAQMESDRLARDIKDAERFRQFEEVVRKTQAAAAARPEPHEYKQAPAPVAKKEEEKEQPRYVIPIYPRTKPKVRMTKAARAKMTAEIHARWAKEEFETDEFWSFKKYGNIDDEHDDWFRATRKQVYEALQKRGSVTEPFEIWFAVQLEDLRDRIRARLKLQPELAELKKHVPTPASALPVTSPTSTSTAAVARALAASPTVPAPRPAPVLANPMTNGTIAPPGGVAVPATLASMSVVAPPMGSMPRPAPAVPHSMGGMGTPTMMSHHSTPTCVFPSRRASHV